MHGIDMLRSPLRTACLSIATAALLACASGPGPAAVERVPGTSIPMRPGDRARLPDHGHLAYVGLRSDSRCPPDVTCVHAGWAELDFVHESPAGVRQPLVLSTRAGTAPARGGSWSFELVEVGRDASPVAHVRASMSRD